VLHLSSLEAVSWLVASCLEVALLGLIVFRKSSRQVLFISVYFVFLLCRDVWWLWASRSVPNISRQSHHAYYISYWISEFVLSLLRLATCVQIWWLSVRAYAVIWKVSLRILVFFSAGLFLWCVLSAYHYREWLVQVCYIGIQRFEFMQAILLITIMALAAYYNIEFRPGFRILLAGLCMYSLVQCIVATISSQNPVLTYPWFNVSRQIAFWGTLGTWFYALLKFSPVSQPLPSAVSSEAYQQFAPQVNYRLRELNDRLAEMLNL
jgi:hypothetical protein